MKVLLPHLVALSLTAACASNPTTPVKIAATVNTAYEHGRTDVRFAFASPVVPDERVGSREPDVTITPEVRHLAFWLDRQTLVVQAENVKPQLKYEVKVGGKLAGHVGTLTQAFFASPLELEQLPDEFLGNQPFELRFNSAVDVQQVIAGCQLLHLPAEAPQSDRDNNRARLSLAPPRLGATQDNKHPQLLAKALEGERIALRPAPAPKMPPSREEPEETEETDANEDQQAHSVWVQPGAKLATYTPYILHCDKLVSKLGAPMAHPDAWIYRSHPAFKVETHAPKADIFASNAGVELEFSTSVDEALVAKALTAEPTIPWLSKGHFRSWNRTFYATGKLKPYTHYKITLAAGLTDRYGQTLTSPYTFEFTTKGAEPAIDMDTGMLTLEASQPGLPVWTRNLRNITVKCASLDPVHVTAEQLALGTWMRSDKPLDWAKHGLVAKSAEIAPPADPMAWQTTLIDMKTACPRTTGLYVVEVSTPELAETKGEVRLGRAVVSVSTLGVVLRSGATQGLAWVTRYADGQPAQGASVTIMDDEGRTLATTRTDERGLATFPIAATRRTTTAAPLLEDDINEEAEDQSDFESSRATYTAIVRADDATAIVRSDWTGEMAGYNFNIPYGEPRHNLRGFIQSDRGLYRPGHTVYFRGLLREYLHDRPVARPQADTVAIAVIDARGNTVHEAKATLNEFGAYSFAYELPELAPVGDYTVQAKLGAAVFNERFQVEEYRPATFTTKVSPGKPVVMADQPVTATIHADYLFGAPVPKAEVTWTLRKRRHELKLPAAEGFYFGQSRYYDDWSEGDASDEGYDVDEGQGVTDATGALAITPKLPTPDKDLRPIDYIISATVADEGGLSMSGSAVVTQHLTDRYLGIRVENDYVQRAGVGFRVDAAAVNTEGKRIASKATLTWRKHTWACERGSCDPKTLELGKQAVTLTASAGGHNLTLAEPGDYELVLSSTDSKGHAISVSWHVWVVGAKALWWRPLERNTMEVHMGKDEYRAGETARIIAPHALEAGWQLVTVERNEILSHQLLRANDPIELAVAEAWGPNAVVTVTAIAPPAKAADGTLTRPRLIYGVANLRVNVDAKKLKVDVTLDKAKARPGETINGTLKLTDAKGAPVAGEVALAVADEAVLALINYKTPNPLRTFMAPWSHGVRGAATHTLFARLTSHFVEEDATEEEGGDYASDNDQQRVRSKFLATVHWDPHLRTNAEGVATFQFTLPDNLTTFRVMAVAADQGELFGAGETSLVVSKPLVLTPALPRVLRAGDDVEVATLVANRTSKPVEVDVTAEAKGLTLATSSAKLTIPAQGSARAAFRAKVLDGTAATLVFKGKTKGERDALTLALPVLRDRRTHTETLIAHELTANAPLIVERPVQPAALPLESELIVTLDPTGMADLEPALRYLVEYPYGCLEQTMSRMMPLLAANELSKQLGSYAATGETAERYLAKGLAKVMAHQRDDGHFSLWPNSEGYPHLTAYAMWGLHVATTQGRKIPNEVFQRGYAALVDAYQSDTALDKGVMAMGAYVATKRGLPTKRELAKLYEQRTLLPRYGAAFLWRALVAAKAPKPQLQEMAKLVAAGIEVALDAAKVTETITSSYDHMHSQARATAMTLAAYTELAPKDPITAQLARGLMAMRSPGGTWTNTQDNVWAMAALTGWGKARGPGKGKHTVTLTLDGKPLGKHEVRGAKAVVVRVPWGAWPTGALKLESTGTLTATARLKVVEPPNANSRAHGFTLTRRYLNENGVELQTWKQGDIITVELKLAGPRQRYVAVQDHLPAGFEPLNPRLATQVPDGDDGDDWAISHSELRDDRALWFIDNYWGRALTLSYRVRAAVPGRYAATGASVEAMYQPDLFAEVGATSVVIQ